LRRLLFRLCSVATRKTVDEKAALAVKGVRQVVNIDEAVAVVADHIGAAKKGLEAAAISCQLQALCAAANSLP
jgi:hypothetical protein